MSNKPFPLAMVICDTVIDDRETNKKSLIGIFNNITSSNFPCKHPRMNVFISITDGRGQVTGKLRCIKKEKDKIKTLVELAGPIKFPDANSVVEFNFELVGIVFPEPGIYSFEFLCNDELIIPRDFAVIKR